jgi:membrane associated rhomboid family serine protease
MNRYGYQNRPGWGRGFAGSMVAKLIIANVVAYLLQGMFNPSFTLTFGLIPDAVTGGLQVWRLATYMFLHGSFSHIFWNMFILWLFGGAIEAVWGSRNFLRYYIFCGIGGGVASLLFYDSIVIGASGAIFGLYLAYAMMFPDNKIYLYFLIPVRAKYLVMGMVIFQLAAGIAGPSGVAYFAHLGGMAAGLFFFKAEIMRRVRFNAGPRRKWQQHINERRREQPPSDGDNIDSILDKISAKGYDHLSTTEKRILENYSRQRKNDSD